MKRGYTLTELVVVTAIILAIAALIFPVIVSAKNRANEAACASKLHQQFQAIKLYQDTYEGPPIYGNSDLMGLPPSTGTLLQEGTVSMDTLTCSGRPFEAGSRAVYASMWLAAPGEEFSREWEAYCSVHKEQSALIVDPNHDRATTPRLSPFSTHRATAILLSGSLQTRSKKGVATTFEFWK